MQIGRRLFAAAAAALGAVGLSWADFAIYWQPIPPDFPAHLGFALLAGALLLVAGVAAQIDRFARPAGWTLAAVFAAFSIPWAIRVVRYPALFGTWGGFAEAFSLVLGSVIIAEACGRSRLRPGPDLERACVQAFGLCAIAFGLNHFFALPQTAAMVPEWIPPGQTFWAVATGVFHCAAGLAILTGIQALLGARLLGIMMLGFSALVWLPNLARSPMVHMTWAGNAENLALAGAAFVVADAIARRRRSQADQHSPQHVAFSDNGADGGALQAQR